jgi:hypothetical protein
LTELSKKSSHFCVHPPRFNLSHHQILGIFIYQNPRQKIAFLTIHDPSLSTRVMSVIGSAIPYSLPMTTDTLPHTPTITDIGTTPYSTSFPLNCRIKTCPFYNGGTSIFNDNTDRLNIAQLHGTSLHHNLLTTLPTHTLTSIGWARCHATCHYFSLSPIDLNRHREDCDASLTDHRPPSPASCPEWACLYAICPLPQHTALSQLILTSHASNPATLFPQVSEWFNESKLPANAPTSPDLDNEL